MFARLNKALSINIAKHESVGHHSRDHFESHLEGCEFTRDNI